MSPYVTNLSSRANLAARCHEIQASLGNREVPEFESIPELGMAVRLALHIQGLPLLNYSTLKLVANHYLSIPTLVVERIVLLLSEIGFVRLQTTGHTINGVLPTVPYYEQIYDQLGEYAQLERPFNEYEQFAIYLADCLSKSPEKVDSLRNTSGADNKLFSRGLKVGTEGGYIIYRRFRSKDVLLSPTYFSENAEVFADVVAARGAESVRETLEAVRMYQGWPLSLIEQNARIGVIHVNSDQIALLKRLAADGAVKPPSIETTYAGQNHFIFTPTPSGAALSPTKRDVYEKAMAIVASIRQGQLLPRRYAIREPGAVLYTLRNNLQLRKATTEATQQYRNLTCLRVARLIDAGNGYSQLVIIDTPENREALDIASALVEEGGYQGMEIDEESRMALQQDQKYIESLIASSAMRQQETVALSQEMQEQMELLFLGGNS